MKTRTLLVLPAIALLVVLTGSLATAAGHNSIRDIKIWGSTTSKPKTSAYYQPTQAIIGVGSYDMVEINRAAVGFSIAEREVIVYNRLTEILSNGPVQPGAVVIRKVRSAPTVFVGPYRLISVYPQDARAVGMTPLELAQKWAQRVAATLPVVAPTAAAVKAGVMHCERPCEQ